MIDAERLLGALIQGAVSSSTRRRSRRPSNNVGGAIGMGLLGVAVAAFDHFAKGQGQSQQGQQQQGQVPGSPANMAPPPLPPPPQAQAASPSTAARQSDAKILIRAMISAANADGQIDPQERGRILQQLSLAGLSSEETNYIESEMLSPLSLNNLLVEISKSNNQAAFKEQVYAAALMATDVDNEAEKSYLKTLATRLGLTDVKSLHDRFGVQLI